MSPGVPLPVGAIWTAGGGRGTLHRRPEASRVVAAPLLALLPYLDDVAAMNLQPMEQDCRISEIHRVPTPARTAQQGLLSFSKA